MKLSCICIIVLSALKGSLGQSGSSSTSTAGTVVAEDFDKNLAAAGQNIYKGVVAVADPVLKFAVDTAPNVAQLYAILNGVNVPPFLVSWGKDIYGKVALGGGKALGKVAVSGSSALSGLMGRLGKGLQKQNDRIASSTSGKGVNPSDSENKTADEVNARLTALGDELIAASYGVNAVSQNISQLFDIVGSRIAHTITSLEQLATKLLSRTTIENGVIKFQDKVNEMIYEALKSYMKWLANIQVMFQQLASKIGGDTSGTGSSNTSVSAATNSFEGNDK